MGKTRRSKIIGETSTSEMDRPLTNLILVWLDGQGKSLGLPSLKLLPLLSNPDKHEKTEVFRKSTAAYITPGHSACNVTQQQGYNFFFLFIAKSHKITLTDVLQIVLGKHMPI